MMEKNNKTNIFYALKISFLLSFVLVGVFGFGLLSKVFADPNACVASIVFDVNPKTGANNQQFTISGSVTVSNLLTDNGNLTGYCDVPGNTTQEAQNVYVTVYDQT